MLSTIKRAFSPKATQQNGDAARGAAGSAHHPPDRSSPGQNIEFVMAHKAAWAGPPEALQEAGPVEPQRPRSPFERVPNVVLAKIAENLSGASAVLNPVSTFMRQRLLALRVADAQQMRLEAARTAYLPFAHAAQSPTSSSAADRWPDVVAQTIPEYLDARQNVETIERIKLFIEGYVRNCRRAFAEAPETYAPQMAQCLALTGRDAQALHLIDRIAQADANMPEDEDRDAHCQLATELLSRPEPAGYEEFARGDLAAARARMNALSTDDHQWMEAAVECAIAAETQDIGDAINAFALSTFSFVGTAELYCQVLQRVSGADREHYRLLAFGNIKHVIRRATPNSLGEELQGLAELVSAVRSPLLGPLRADPQWDLLFGSLTLEWLENLPMGQPQSTRAINYLRAA